jgi:hypothetical protein
MRAPPPVPPSSTHKIIIQPFIGGAHEILQCVTAACKVRLRPEIGLRRRSRRRINRRPIALRPSRPLTQIPAQEPDDGAPMITDSHTARPTASCRKRSASPEGAHSTHCEAAAGSSARDYLAAPVQSLDRPHVAMSRASRRARSDVINSALWHASTAVIGNGAAAVLKVWRVLVRPRQKFYNRCLSALISLPPPPTFPPNFNELPSGQRQDYLDFRKKVSPLGLGWRPDFVRGQ